MSKIESMTVKLVHLDTLLMRERDMQLDMIKVTSRSDDQANSACNLVKQLYSYFYYIANKEVHAYINKNEHSENDIDFSNKDVQDRISELIFATNFSNGEKYNISKSEKQFLKPFSKYKLGKWLSIISELVGVYGGKWHSENGSFQVINGIKLMKHDIDRMNDGYNPYN